MAKTAKFYPPLEEKLNVYSHLLGVVLSIVGLLALIWHSTQNGTALHVVSFTIFGVSMVLLYTASTLYHRTTTEQSRLRMRVLDHAAIYLLIAGTYTPFTLLVLDGVVGWTIFGICWGMAVLGVILKLFFTGHFNALSTLLYVAMGWMIVFAIGPLMENFAPAGLRWLIAGGVAYTVGAVLYSIKAIPLNHALFHILVLAGSISHFIAVYFYILPHPNF